MAPKTRALRGQASSNDVVDERRSLRNRNSQYQLRPLRSSDRAGGSCEDPPTYTIDLSLPPQQRYVAVAKDFQNEVNGLSSLFKEVVPRKQIRKLAKMLLRRVYSKEETEELRGISQAVGVGMHLLVCFNVLLDLFMGCTSSAVRVAADDFGPSRMLHLRTLDWGMEPLRSVIVKLDFVERPGSGVIATSITYVGFVGVLTGVRKDLSVSLNFRPVHNTDSMLANAKFYSQLVLVLFGLKPSISSILRTQLLGRGKSSSRRGISSSNSLENIKNAILALRTTAAYLILSDGRKSIVIEKDRKAANVRTSSEFIVATNHDESRRLLAHTTSPGSATNQMDIAFEEFSIDRSGCVSNKFKDAKKAKKEVTASHALTWLVDWPTTNTFTHFAALMDPLNGNVLWCKRWLQWPRGPRGEIVEMEQMGEIG